MTIRHQTGPFAIVPLWVHQALIEHGAPQALSLYIALHEWTAGDDRTAHPSRLKLAATCGVSERTIDAYVKALSDVKALLVTARWTEDGDRTSNDYTILVAPPGAVGCPTGGEADEGTGGEADCAVTRPTSNQTHLDHTNTPLAEARLTKADAFAEFWSTYIGEFGSKSSGSKGAAHRAWMKMKRPDQEIALEVLQGQIRRRTDAHAVPNASTWLNDYRWMDDELRLRPTVQATKTRPNPYADEGLFS